MQESELKDIGLRIVSIRDYEGLLQKDLAAEAGLHKKTISLVENGHRPPTQELLNALVKHGYNIDWILTGRGKTKTRGEKPDSKSVLHAKVLKMEQEIKQLKEMMKVILEKQK